MIRILTITLTALVFVLAAAAAQAAPVRYVLETPGVVWGGTSARARAAVEKVEDVTSVQADMSAHTVTVEFDDEKVGIAAIVGALNDAGYVVKEKRKVE